MGCQLLVYRVAEELIDPIKNEIPKGNVTMDSEMLGEMLGKI